MVIMIYFGFGCRELGYTPDQLEKLVTRLVQHSKHNKVKMRTNALHALTQLGMGERKDVIMAVLQNLTHEDVSDVCNLYCEYNYFNLNFSNPIINFSGTKINLDYDVVSIFKFFIKRPYVKVSNYLLCGQCFSLPGK